MASIGSYYVRVLPDMSGFTSGLVTGLGASGVGNAGTNTGRTFGQRFSNGLLGFISRIAIGTTIGRIVTSGFNTIVGGFSSGIERLDIVENYPRILENLGIANEDSARSIQRLQDALLGLPTSLQDGVTATQRLTATFGDVDRGTDAFIAFNNALVAGMAPAALQSAALEQFSQAIAKGKPDMLEWRSMVNAMPAQMAQVAASFDMTTAELGEALRNGDLSMDEFVDAFIRLNEEGGEGFASFADQAHTATNTIGTAITNLGNRVAAGWAKIFEVFGQGNIANAINNISNGVLAGFTAIAETIRWLKYTILGSGIGEAIQTITEQISSALGSVGESLPSVKDVLGGIVDAVNTALTAIADSGIVESMATIATQVIDIISNIVDMLPSASGVIEGIVGAISGVVGAIADSGLVNVLLPAVISFIEVLLGYNLATWIGGVAAAIGTFITALNPMTVIAGGIATLIGMIVNWIATTDEGRAAWEWFVDVVSTKWEELKAAAAVVVENVQASWQALQEFASGVYDVFAGIINGIVQFFLSVRETVRQFISKLIAAVVGLFVIIVQTAMNYAAAIFNVVLTIVSTVVQFFAALPSNLAGIWASIVSGVSTAWTNVRTFIVNAAGAIRLNVTSAFNQLRNTVGTVWNNIKSAITTPINAARDAVQNAIERIKGFFNFRISWPHIPLPHFSVSGSANPLDWLSGGLPSFSVRWYAKGGMVDTPTVWLAGAGEKGAELVWPSYEPYMGKYAAAIAEHMDSTGTVNNYYIDGNLAASDARLAAALDVVAERVGGRRRMGSVRA